MLTLSFLQFALWVSLAFVLGGLTGAVNCYISAWRVVRFERARADRFKSIAHAQNYGAGPQWTKHPQWVQDSDGNTVCFCTNCRLKRGEK